MKRSVAGILIYLMMLCLSARADVDYKTSIILVTTDSASGSGFIVQEGERFFVVSNAHVFGDCRGLKLQLLDGTQLGFDGVRFSKNKDIAQARLKIGPELSKLITPLSPAQEDISIGNKIVVYGNSQGKNVVTELKGKVTGVGPNEIEVDAGFVSGNSGSPIVNKAGEVVGVATYATRSKAPEWTVEGTRFAKTRRFGVRLDGIQWSDASVRDLQARSDYLNDVEAYVQDAARFVFAWIPYYSEADRSLSPLEKAYRNRAYQELSAKELLNYNSKTEKEKYSKAEWAETLHKFCDLYHETSIDFWNAKHDVRRLANDPNVVRRARRDQARVLSQARAHIKTMFASKAEGMRKSDWKTPHLKAKAEQLSKSLELLDKIYKGSSEHWENRRGEYSAETRATHLRSRDGQ